jgi:RNA polymerase sigma-70 factor (ECF subfamily)
MTSPEASFPAAGFDPLPELLHAETSDSPARGAPRAAARKAHALRMGWHTMRQTRGATNRGRNLRSINAVVEGMHADSPCAEVGAWAGGAHGRTLFVSRAEVDIAMERYGAGDEAAFAVVYDTLAPRLYGYFLRQTRDPSRAEDLLQQTMLHMHRARDRFIPGAEVTPWAFAIGRRLLVDGIRKSRREVLVEEPEAQAGASPGPSGDDVVRARELASQVEGVLAKLPTSQRTAFELIKGEGLSLAEAAQVLGTTVSAVKLRAHRAYEALRSALGDGFAGGSEGRSGE